MKQLNLFIELTRLKNPTGYMLLFWPCAWGLTVAYDFSNKIDIFSKGDHRVAMSFAVLGLLLGGNLKIHNFETVKTSFPNFINLVKNIGGKIEIKKN